MLPTAIILAGGFGTRLRSVVQAIPKPMAPVRNRPFLDFQLDWLRKHGCMNVILSTGHLAEKVSDHYGEDYRDMSLHYSVETSPLGTGGAVRRALQHCPGAEALVLNGDSFFAIDLAKQAVARCLSNSRHPADTIDILICTNIARFDEPGQTWIFEPSTSVRLRQHFVFNRAFAFDITNAFAGMFTGIYILYALIRS